jgi:hypothetical protein
VIIWMLAAACGAGTGGTQVDAGPTWNLLAQLVADGAPIEPDRIANRLGVKLESAGETSALRISSGGPAGPFRSVRVQVATSPAAHSAVTLEVAPGPCGTREEARARFGFQHSHPDHPGRPPGPVQYASHDLEWGQLMLGFDRATGCLTTASIEAR